MRLKNFFSALFGKKQESVATQTQVYTKPATKKKKQVETLEDFHPSFDDIELYKPDLSFADENPKMETQSPQQKEKHQKQKKKEAVQQIVVNNGTISVITLKEAEKIFNSNDSNNMSKYIAVFEKTQNVEPIFYQRNDTDKVSMTEFKRKARHEFADTTKSPYIDTRAVSLSTFFTRANK